MGKVIDLTGQVFGNLTVLERAPNNANGSAMWKCQCNCKDKNIIIARGADLRRGHTKSCGCYQRQRTREASMIDIAGKQVGNFIPLEYIYDNDTKGNKGIWRCKCLLCGNTEAYITPFNMRRQYSCGCDTSSKGERKIKSLLDEANVNYIQEKSFSDLKFDDTQHFARFDFYINNQYLIEYNGQQHYIQGDGVFDNEIKFNKTQEHDDIKKEYCKKNQIPLIIIPYTHYSNLSIEDLKLETTSYRVV